MVTHGPILFLIASLLALAAAAEDKKKGKEKKGFLALDRDEEGLWNAFAESERKLRSHDVVQQRETSSAHQSQPQEETDRPILPDWETGVGMNVWVVDPAEPGSQEPVILNYSLPVMLGTPPCEQRIQDCTSMTQSCVEIKELLAGRIIETQRQLQLTANGNPLLSTLAINRSVHLKRSDMPLHPSAPGIPSWHSTANRLSYEAAISSSPGQLRGKAPMQPVAKPSWQLGEAAFATPPRDLHMPDIEDARVSSREVIGHIAHDIASELPHAIAHEVAEHVNSTCAGDETVMLDDCQSYNYACMDSVEHQRQSLRTLRRQLRESQEQIRLEEQTY